MTIHSFRSSLLSSLCRAVTASSQHDIYGTHLINMNELKMRERVFKRNVRARELES
jgi:hypothetical protein